VPRKNSPSDHASACIRWARPFERQYTPEEIMTKLEERVGPEGRRLFENFLRKVKRVERNRQVSVASTQP
jgi:hypothetical protein